LGKRIEPDPVWVTATEQRYQRFSEVGTGQ
jgi:hypothetical protein